MELNADLNAAKLGHAKGLIKYLKSSAESYKYLNESRSPFNKFNKVCWLTFERLFSSHPGFVKRIEELKKYEQQKQDDL